MRRLAQLAVLLLGFFLVAPVVAQQGRPPKIPSIVSPLPYTGGELQDIFKFYNRAYWNGKLPATVVIWTGLPTRFGETTQLPDGSYVIRLDVIKNKEINVARTTLLHEMCHVKTWGESCHVGAKLENCTRWLAELHRIMLEGAFDDIV